MKEKEFDNLIRARLRNHESPVPAGMWERIAVKEKKRRGGFTTRFYLLIIIFLLIGFAGIFYSSNLHNQPTKEIVSDKSSTSNTRNETNLVQSTNKVERSESIMNLPKNGGGARPESVIGKQHQGKNNQALKTGKKSKNTAYDTQVFNPGENIVESNNDEKISADIGEGASGNTEKKLVKETTDTRQDPASEAKMDPSQYESDRFSLELFISPAVPINSISSDNIAYEHTLKRSSSMQLSYTIGARISYSISKRFSAKTGVQFNQVNEKMNFMDSAGNNFSSTNRYKNIGVPLLIGYKLVSANSLDLFINTGIILNVVSTYKGMIPSSGTGQPIDIKNENVYNTNPSADLYFAVNLSKKMNTRTDFFAEPWMNYRLRNMVSHYYSFDQKINTLGLSIGLRYRLYKNEPPR
jgi:hypothetical protein